MLILWWLDRGPFFWEGPAARSDQQNGPTLQDIIKKTAVPLQWEALNSNYIVYPVGKADVEWKDAETGDRHAVLALSGCADPINSQTAFKRICL